MRRLLFLAEARRAHDIWKNSRTTGSIVLEDVRKTAQAR